ncbi:hypothetical protein [Kineosporia sp. NBRC 101731]|uniref:hypothetical protein n=1 Tax=Kineosporia sp. NBRC 101731 TaxID=3032199 RepID=UPI0024A30B62|nr:hypothetical protein Kisp02_28710 [Kineosporia sp. NBRC 101731]
MVNYAAPSLGTELGAPSSGVAWFLSIYSLAFGLGLVPGGRLGDALGRRPLFVTVTVTVTQSGMQRGLLICSGLVLTACVLSFSPALQVREVEAVRKTDR